MQLRLSLDEADFRRLVAGEVVEKEMPLHSLTIVMAIETNAKILPVAITLQDIGWGRIVDAVQSAILTKGR